MVLHLRKCALAALLTVATLVPAVAQQSAPQPASPQLRVPNEPPGAQGKLADPKIVDPMAVPGFWDPRRRPERPDLTRISIIRFLTETDYPPFNFTGADGTPAGFNVDLARLLCEEIKVPCTVQQRRFDTLIPSLNKNEGDAIIASLGETPDMRKQVDFSEPYYRTPARFVSRRDVAIEDVRPQALEGRKIAVVAGTAHEAYLKTLFTEAELHPYPTDAAARFALKRGEVDLLFGDGISLAFWLNGTELVELLRVPRRAVSGEQVLRRRRRHRGQARQRSDAASVQLGAVPAMGERPLHRSMAALFPDQPFLSAHN